MGLREEKTAEMLEEMAKQLRGGNYVLDAIDRESEIREVLPNGPNKDYRYRQMGAHRSIKISFWDKSAAPPCEGGTGPCRLVKNEGDL